MRTRSSRTPPWPPDRQEMEAQLLAELQRAEAEFKQAGSGQKAAAEEVFRRALRKFSELVLDPRRPPGLSGRF